MTKTRRGDYPLGPDPPSTARPKKKPKQRQPLGAMENEIHFHDARPRSQLRAVYYPTGRLVSGNIYSLAVGLVKTLLGDFFSMGWYHAKAKNDVADQLIRMALLDEPFSGAISVPGCDESWSKDRFSVYLFLKELSDPNVLFACCCYLHGMKGGSPKYPDYELRMAMVQRVLEILCPITMYSKVVLKLLIKEISTEAPTSGGGEDPTRVFRMYFDCIQKYMSPFLEDVAASIFSYIKRYRECSSFLQKEEIIPPGTTLKDWALRRSKVSTQHIALFTAMATGLRESGNSAFWCQLCYLLFDCTEEFVMYEKKRSHGSIPTVSARQPDDMLIVPTPTFTSNYNIYRGLFVAMCKAKIYPPTISDLTPYSESKNLDDPLILNFADVKECNTLHFEILKDVEVYNKYVAPGARLAIPPKKSNLEIMAEKHNVDVHVIARGTVRPKEFRKDGKKKESAEASEVMGPNDSKKGKRKLVDPKNSERMHRFCTSKQCGIKKDHYYIGCPFCIHCIWVNDTIAQTVSSYSGNELKEKMMVNGGILIKFEQKPSHDLRVLHHGWKKMYNHIREEHLRKEVRLIDDPSRPTFVLQSMSDMPLLFQLQEDEYQSAKRKSDDELRADYDRYALGYDEKYSAIEGDKPNKVTWDEFRKEHHKSSSWQLIKKKPKKDPGAESSLREELHKTKEEVACLKSRLFDAQQALIIEREQKADLLKKLAALDKGS